MKTKTSKPQRFVLECTNLSHCDARKGREPKRFAAAVIVDRQGRFVGLDKHCGGEQGFFCESCGSKAIAYLPLSERAEDNQKRTIGNQITLPLYDPKQQ